MGIVEVESAVRSFGAEKVLKGIGFQIEEGEIFGLIGPSGAGKTTLIRLLTGYLTPDEGRVRVFGRDPAGFDASDRRMIGFMPQGFVLYGGLSVRQNLEFAARIYGLRFMERRRRVRQTLEFTELWGHRRKAAANISGGMQRRLQLAAATVHSPRLLFADEPTASLDPVLRRKFWEEFRRLRDEGHSIVVTTQYIGEAEYCDRVGLLSDGILAAEGSPQRLRREAFGGELISLTLAGDSGRTGHFFAAMGKVGDIAESHVEHSGGESVIGARLVVEDADTALPGLLADLNTAGAEVRSAEAIVPSFDEVFFRLVRG